MPRHVMMDANEAAVRVAYLASEVTVYQRSHPHLPHGDGGGASGDYPHAAARFVTTVSSDS